MVSVVRNRCGSRRLWCNHSVHLPTSRLDADESKRRAERSVEARGQAGRRDAATNGRALVPGGHRYEMHEFALVDRIGNRACIGSPLAPTQEGAQAVFYVDKR
jgi:hypothetical protein